MQDPTNRVVDELGLGVRLVTALVGDDPEAGHDEARTERVELPDGEAEDRVEVGVREADLLRSNDRIEVRRGFVDGCDQDEIPDADGGRVSRKRRVEIKVDTYM